MVLRIDVGCLVFSRFDLFSLQFNDLGNQISNSLAEELKGSKPELVIAVQNLHAYIFI